MRSFWPTAVLVGILVSLAGYLYVVELPQERTKTLAEAVEKKLLAIEEREVTGLTVRTGTTDVVLAQADATAWKVTAPIKTDADPREVSSLLRALVLGKVSRVIEERATALEAFGLEKPAAVITLHAGARTESLTIGDSGPLSNTLYAMRASDKKVLLTDLAPKDVLNKTLQTFRRKDIVRFDQNRLVRVRLVTSKSEILLERAGEPPKAKWAIKFPLETRADQIEVRSLLLKLDDFKARGFIDPGPEHEALRKQLTEPAVRMTLEETGGLEKTLRLFQLDPVSGEAYAVGPADGPIYRITPDAIHDFSKELFALLDKRLLGTDREEIGFLKVKTRDEEYTLINQTGMWVLEEKPTESLDQQKINLFVSRVVDLPAELRVIKGGVPLAPYGLHAPTAEFTALGKDGKERGRMSLGAKAGGLVYAMGQGLSGIYQARADILTQIPAKSELMAGPAKNTGSPPQ
ncbi:MAG: DUF4340 domain-containing protein [Nitrospira sp.]|nr:MAG: DUF4340 domain-containing protein [Nitrospira sp.]